MENRRIETAPVWLVALATAALGMTAAVTIQWTAPVERAAADPPRRTTAPIRWPLAGLAPLELSSLALDQLSPRERFLSTRIAAPSIADSLSLAELTAADPLLTAPLGPLAAARDAGSMVLLIASQPQWRAGDAAPLVITSGMRRDWSVGPIDTIALARSAGRGVAAPSVALRRARGAAPVRTANRWLRDAFAQATAVPASRAVTLTRRPTRPELSFELPTITRYLDRSATHGAFPVPVAMGGQLDRVAETRELAPWAWAVAYRLRTLAATPVDDVAAHRALAALADASDEAFAQAGGLDDAARATELRRAGYALSRRLATWRAEQTRTLAALQRPAAGDPLVGARWAMSPQGLGLAPGLLLSEPSTDQPQTLRVAQRVEEYERAPSSRLARALATDAARLAVAEDQADRNIGSAINGAYRNANVRVAIAADLIERMLPQPEPVTSVVRDRIAGTPVSGRSTTRTELAVRLVEDPSVWRLGLEARGMVNAQTYSRGGPAVVGARGATSFVAKKLVVFTPTGLQAAPTVATAQTESQRLVSLATDYDRVPLLGNYVRSAARSEYGRLRPRAKAETRLKVERQVVETIDAGVTPRLAEIEQRFASDVVARAEALGLRIEPLEMRTTEERLITRVRVAGDQQLAAHTPRMRAPSDSLFSLQMHESMLNNALEGLGLSGQTVTPEQLRQRLAERLRLSADGAVGADRAVFRFAEEDAIRFSLAEGRAQLTLSLDEIVVAGRRHRNFKVHAFYRPEASGLTAELVQDGAPHIEGRMRTASRLHLHGVMGKVLGENKRIPLVRMTADTPERVAAALAGLSTNQLVIEDGWIGLAIGPPREAGRVAVQVGGYVR